MSQVTSTLLTSGMHCGSCSMLIDMTLSDLDGVIESKTDHATGKSVVTYDNDKVGVQDLIDAIKGAGYESQLAE